MRLQMSERQVGDVTVIDLSGQLVNDQGSQNLKDKINSLIQQARKDIILNLAEISYIDSAGLGQLVASYTSITRATGALKLIHVNKRNHDLLSITRLVTLFDTFDTEEEAVSSFQQRRAG